MSDTENREGWEAVFTASTDYEADIVRDRLDDAGIPAVVYTQRDHSFNLNVGDLARTAVFVPPSHAAQAREVLASARFTDEELDSAAMRADPISPDAHTADDEALLDSGIEKISLSVPGDDDDSFGDRDDDSDDDVVDDSDDDVVDVPRAS